MTETKIARVYAEAIFDIAKRDDNVFPVLEMLDVLLKHIKEDIDFKKFLDYPIIQNDDKKKLISLIYQDIKDKPLEVLNYLIDKNRLSHIEGIRNEYLKIYYEIHNQLIVTAIFAKQISKEQEERLIQKLEKMKNKKILLHTVIDESIIAGGIIKIDDEVIDGSIKSQIKDIRAIF